MSYPAEIVEASPGNLMSEHEAKSAKELIYWALDTFGERIAICTSFQAEGMVILDLAWRTNPNVRVFTLDTGRLPQETYDLINRVRERYQVPIQVFYPDQDELSRMVTDHGTNPFYRSMSLRLLCCQVRKVNPLKRALQDVDAWITGLRRSESDTRLQVPRIEIDSEHGNILKLNPLADWSTEEVWDYIKSNHVPYNRLYDQGYTSIGCAPCTRAIQPGEHPRAGRWWWENGAPKECGIHWDRLAKARAGSL